MKTIKSSSEISHVFEVGRRVKTPDINLIVLRKNEQHDQRGRVAFIAGKKLGNAVWRNKAKRRMREICAQIGGPFEGYDVLFVAKKSINQAPFSSMKRNVAQSLGKIDIPVN